MTLAADPINKDVNRSRPITALWLTLNPSLKRLDQRLLCQLSRRVKVHRWEYVQTIDEPCCFETAIALLHETVSAQSQPLHLLGHGINGALALLYAHRYPQHVRSLTLLSVGSNPGVTWHSHYYALRELLPCDRQILLQQMARMLLGHICPAAIQALAQLLAQDLDNGFAPHSLAHTTTLAIAPLEIPLLVCAGQQDAIIDPHNRQRWQNWLQSNQSNSTRTKQQFWECPEGRHFLHFEAPDRVASRICDYWASLAHQAEFVNARS